MLMLSCAFKSRNTCVATNMSFVSASDMILTDHKVNTMDIDCSNKLDHSYNGLIVPDKVVLNDLGSIEKARCLC